MPLNRLARMDTEKERLFGALEAFVNLADGLGGLESFLQQWPAFCPVVRGVIGEHPPRPRLGPSLHELILHFRDHLREVWQGLDRTGEKIAILLGLRDWTRIYLKPDEMDWNELDLGSSVLLPGPKYLPNWKTGQFAYYPGNDFQGAVYLLFKASWRAKACSHCSSYFIASKPAQLYCKPACANATKQRRNQDWWAEHGKEWRDKSKGEKSRKVEKRKRR